MTHHGTKRVPEGTRSGKARPLLTTGCDAVHMDRRSDYISLSRSAHSAQPTTRQRFAEGVGYAQGRN